MRAAWMTRWVGVVTAVVAGVPFRLRRLDRALIVLVAAILAIIVALMALGISEDSPLISVPVGGSARTSLKTISPACGLAIRVTVTVPLSFSP